MKIKYVIGILVLGVGVYYLIIKQKKVAKTNTERSNEDNVYKNEEERYSIDSLRKNYEKTADQFKNNKEKTAEEIKNRHEAAAQQMRESLSNIVSTDENIKTVNTETLYEMTEDIDKLME